MPRNWSIEKFDEKYEDKLAEIRELKSALSSAIVVMEEESKINDDQAINVLKQIKGLCSTEPKNVSTKERAGYKMLADLVEFELRGIV